MIIRNRQSLESCFFRKSFLTKRRMLLGNATFAVIFGLIGLFADSSCADQNTSDASDHKATLWKTGFVKAVITPDEPMWMSGYQHRLAKDKLHDLWVKVLALEDRNGHRAVVITADVCGFSKLSYEAICAALKERCQLERAQIMLTCTHTHTGPALRECLHACWPWENEEVRKQVERYSLQVEAKIVEAVVKACSEMSPAQLFAGEGTATFAVNRRNNPEQEVTRIREAGQILHGPVDHSIPMLAVRAPGGALRFLLFGYACHATTLASSEWSGDYPGYAMLELEKKFSGVEAMFFQGCGGDQNPLPRRSVELCQKYGHLLAVGVETALKHPMRQLSSQLATAFEFVNLDFKNPHTLNYLQTKAKEKSVQGILAARYLQQLDTEKTLPRSHPYVVQVWKLGDEQLWISLSGEVVVDYSLAYKAKYGQQTWVNGFAHDLVCYIPSSRVLREGGGQEVGVPWSYGLPAQEWGDDIEGRINASVDRLVRQLK